MKCSDDVINDMLSGVIVSGGNTMFPGFVERMQKEMAALAPSGVKVNVVSATATAAERMNAVWKGASMLANGCISAQQMCSMKEYEGSGSAVVYTRFN